MARMIPQRKSPPYLLIIMVFFFLISTGLAVKWYMDLEEARKRTVVAEKITNTLATQDELERQVAAYLTKAYPEGLPVKGHSIPELCEAFKTAAGKAQQPNLTVTARLEQQVVGLARDIVGSDATHEQAEILAADLRLWYAKKKGQLGGLVAKIRQLEDALVKKDEQIATFDKTRQDEQEKFKQRDAQIAALDAAQREKIKDLERARDTAVTQVRTEQTSHEKRINTLENTKAAREEELNKQIAVQGTKIAEQSLTIKTATAKEAILQAKVSQLEGRIAFLKRQRDVIATAVRTISPDGAVMNDPDRQGYCYINIGAKDGVRRNWTFAVYAPGPITENTKNKGALVVTRVMPDVAECRLTRDTGGEVASIAKGDPIANLAFDKSRTYSFVVEGVFDLHGTGKPTLAGTAAVKTLIRNYGGKVSDEVTVSSDYVVLGNEMPKPVEPGPDSPPQVRKAYEDNLNIWQQYNSIKNRAIELKIPILNANRFLDYIGQMPEKRLEYSD